MQFRVNSGARAGLRGQVDERRSVDRLRERLYLAGGRPASHQRAADDPPGTWSLPA